MGKLTKSEVNKLLKGLEYTFKKRDTKKSRSENLNKQIELRESLKEFDQDANENETFDVPKELGELFTKKLEYKWKNNEKNKELINKLTS